MKDKEGRTALIMLAAAAMVVVIAVGAIWFRSENSAAGSGEDPVVSDTGIMDTGADPTNAPENSGDSQVQTTPDPEAEPTKKPSDGGSAPVNTPDSDDAPTDTRPADPVPGLSSDYAYVLAYWAQGINQAFPGADGEDRVEVSARAEVLFPNGACREVELAVTYDPERDQYFHNEPLESGVENTMVETDGRRAVGIWAACAENDDGTYTLYPLDGSCAAAAETLSGLAEGESYGISFDGGVKYTSAATVTVGYVYEGGYVTDSYVGLPGKDAVLTFSGVDILFVSEPGSSEISRVYVVGAPVTTE